MPHEAFLQEINEFSIRAFQHFFKRFLTWHALLASGIWSSYRLVVILEEQMPPRWQLKNFGWWLPAYFHDICQLIDLILSRKQWKARVELSHDATKAPHINCWSIWYTQNNFWCTIKPWLNISINPRPQKAGASIIDHLNSTLILLLE